MSHPFADMLREVVAGTRVDPGMAKATPAAKPEARIEAKPEAKPGRRKGNSAASED